MNTRVIDVVNLVAAFCAVNLFSDRTRGVVDGRSAHCLVIAVVAVAVIRIVTARLWHRCGGWAWREFCHGAMVALAIDAMLLGVGWSRSPPPMITLGGLAVGLLWVAAYGAFWRVRGNLAS